MQIAPTLKLWTFSVLDGLVVRPNTDERKKFPTAVVVFALSGVQREHRLSVI